MVLRCLAQAGAKRPPAGAKRPQAAGGREVYLKLLTRQTKIQRLDRQNPATRQTKIANTQTTLWRLDMQQIQGLDRLKIELST